MGNAFESCNEARITFVNSDVTAFIQRENQTASMLSKIFETIYPLVILRGLFLAPKNPEDASLDEGL